MANVAKFIPKERPLIEDGNPTWETIEQWAQAELVRLRAKREEVDADQRKLDVALGSILVLTRLLDIPETIRQERKRDPVLSEGFNIPPPTGY